MEKEEVTFFRRGGVLKSQIHIFVLFLKLEDLREGGCRRRSN